MKVPIPLSDQQSNFSKVATQAFTQAQFLAFLISEDATRCGNEWKGPLTWNPQILSLYCLLARFQSCFLFFCCQLNSLFSLTKHVSSFHHLMPTMCKESFWFRIGKPHKNYYIWNSSIHGWEEWTCVLSRWFYLNKTAID